MPYIKEEARERVSANLLPENPGELNFLITEICRDYIHHFHGPNYKLLNEVVGVLECVKQELYRRVVGPYEDDKQQENGDVWYPL